MLILGIVIGFILGGNFGVLLMAVVKRSRN